MNTMCENLPGLCEKGEMMKQGSSIPKIHFKNEDRVFKNSRVDVGCPDPTDPSTQRLHLRPWGNGSCSAALWDGCG